MTTMTTAASTPRPFFKCVGGKTQLIPELLKHIPRNFNAYHEPMVGGGALFWALAERGLLDNMNVYLSDKNIPTIHAYRVVRDRPWLVIKELKRLEKAYRKDGEGTFYRVRDEWNKGRTGAARFIFLRQTSFNGLWRYNSKGEINMPWGHYESPSIPDMDRILMCSQVLQKVHLNADDISGITGSRTEGRLSSGDLVYLDPPYWGCFDFYTMDGFSLEQQIRLIQKCSEFVEWGATVIYTNENNEGVRSVLKTHWKRAQAQIVKSRRYVNRDGQGREPVEDLVVSGPSTPRSRKRIPAKSVRYL